MEEKYLNITKFKVKIRENFTNNGKAIVESFDSIPLNEQDKQEIEDLTKLKNDIKNDYDEIVKTQTDLLEEWKVIDKQLSNQE